MFSRINSKQLVKLVSLIGVILFCLPALSSTWLEIGPDARGVAMGTAQVADAAGAYASYWNPAGLTTKHGVVSTYGKLMGEISYRYIGYSQPLLSGSFGASYISNEMSGFKSTEYSNDGRPVVVGADFGSSESALLLSYASNLNSNLQIGGTVKLLESSLQDASASGLSFDLGFKCQYSDSLSIGGVAYNLASSGLSWSTGVTNELPMQVKVGVKYQAWSQLLVVSAFDVTGYDNPKAYLGAEYCLADNLQVRAGYSKNAISLGLGLKYQNVEFDFAYTKPMVDYMEASTRFSIGYVFPAK